MLDIQTARQLTYAISKGFSGGHKIVVAFSLSVGSEQDDPKISMTQTATSDQFDCTAVNASKRDTAPCDSR